MPRLYFCFPYRGVGGVSLLFLRVAEQLAEQGLAQTFLVDYTDGFMAKNRREGLATLVKYREDKPVEIPADAIAVFQSMTPWSIFPSLRLAARTRVLFWNCHPFNLVPTLPGFRGPMQSNPILADRILGTVLRSWRDKMRRLVELMLKRHSLVFMDRGNVAVTRRYLGVAIPDPVYLPIPAPLPAVEPPVRASGLTGRLRIVWVGRVVDFKYHILLRALIETDRAQTELGLPVTWTVVGSGEYKSRLESDARDLRNIEVRFVDHVAPTDLDGFLATEADVLMAMGTSALEGAKLGIPTILLDVAYAPVSQDYQFQWLHERRGFSLGELIGPEHFVPHNRSLLAHLRAVLEHYPDVSGQARAHFMRFHALPAVAGELLRLAQGARCTWGDMAQAGLVRPGMLYSTFRHLRKGLIKA